MATCKRNDGRLLNEKEGILNTWVQHFDNVLNGEGELIEYTDIRAVSYTHLDVYKRQVQTPAICRK